MNKIQVEIIMLSESITFNHTYTLVLGEKNGGMRFSLVIGKYEAQAIALSLDGLNPVRPVTHDLMQKSFQIFNIEIIEVIITEIKEGIFYSVVVCKKGDIIVEIDARTSDAIALALRFKCPIYVNKDVLDAVGSVFEELENKTIEQFEEELASEEDQYSDELIQSVYARYNFEGDSNEILEERMQKALDNEDYEFAAKIRDELNKRMNEKE